MALSGNRRGAARRLRAAAGWAPFAALALAALCWSGNHVAGRAVAGLIPPLELAFLRWLVPVVVLTPIAFPRLISDWHGTIRPRLPVLIWLGATGGAAFGALQYVGLQHTAALNVSILNSLGPIFIVATGALFFRDPLKGSQALGLVCSLLGALVLVARGDWSALVAMNMNPGDLIILGNMVIWGLYAASLRLVQPIDWLSLLYLISVISAVVLFPGFLWQTSGILDRGWDAKSLGVVAYVSLFPGAVAFAAWNHGVAALGSNVAAPTLHLIPLFTAVLGGLFLGETLAHYHVVGFVLIVAGVAVATRAGSAAVPAGRSG